MLDVLIIKGRQKAVPITKRNIVRCRLLWTTSRERYCRTYIETLAEAEKFGVAKQYATKHLKEVITKIKELKAEKIAIEKESENSPDFYTKNKINGVLSFISIWKKKDKNGNTYLSYSIRPVDEEFSQAPKNDFDNALDDPNSIPF